MQRTIINRKPSVTNNVSSKSFLEKLKTLIDFMGLKSSIIKPENSVEQLIIALEEIDDPISMQVMFIEDPTEDKKGASILQLMISFPIIVTSENILGMSALIARINPILPVGAFGISPSDNIYLRHTIMAKDKENIDRPTVVEIIDIMVFFANLVGEKLDLFAQNKLTLEKCLKDLEASMMS